jgi:murein DD-endopeptidase MepM/ murein hydrolase activator NlpD
MLKSRRTVSALLLLHWLGLGTITTFLPLLPLAAQAEVIIEAPETGSSAPPAPVNPEPVNPSAVPVNPIVEVPSSAPIVIDPAPVDVGEPPTRSAPSSVTIEAAPGGTPPATGSVDPENYNLGATTTPTTANPPRQVVLDERSTGCQAVLQPNQAVPTTICDLPALSANSAPPIGLSRPTGWGDNSAYPGAYPVSNNRYGTVPSNEFNLAAYLPNGKNAFNWLQLAGKAMRFPLLLPAPITSGFGWRLHPISNTWRFHNGIDLGAATGTPVVAVHNGQVLAANPLGGYGLTVILSHQKQEWQTLYGHLSQIAVKPGQEVRQGDLIGFVGSTGNSTGPHLHFEILQSTPEGPVAINPGAHLQFALAELIQALRVAQAKPNANPQS